MDQNKRSEHLSAGEPASTASLDFDENTTPVSNYSTVPDNTYKIDSLEVHSEQQGAQIALPNTARSIFRSFSKRRAVIVSTIIAVLVTLSTGATALWLGKNAPKTNDASRLNVPVQGIELQGQSTSNLPAELQGAAESLVVSGDVITRGNLKFSNNSFVTIIQPSNQTADQTFTLPNASGTLCLDSNNCAFAQQADIDLLNGQLNALATQLGQIVVPQVPPSATINSQTGSVVLQGTTNQISVTTNNGTITLSTPQDLAQTSSPTFANAILNGNLNIGGSLTLSLNCTTFLNGGSLTTDAFGQVVCADDETSGGGTSVTTSGGTIGTIPLFDAADQIEDSIITQALGAIAIGGNLGVTGTGTFTGTVSGADAVNNNEFVTLSQLNGAIGGIDTGVDSLNSLSGNVVIDADVSHITVADDGAETITLSLPNSGVVADGYGSASAVATFTVDAQGRLTAATTTAIAIAGNQITSGTIDDGRLSGNVTLLGSTITKDELTDSGALGFTWLDGEVANDLTIDWAGLQNYPTGCGAGEAVTAIGDTLTCGNFATGTDLAGYVELQAGTPGTPQTGHLNISGTAIANAFNGDGLNLTNLNATNIASGTLSVDRIADGSLTNLKLANSSLTVTAGAGLIDGGSISLGSAATLNIGSGDGIAVNADDITLALQDSKGLEVNVDGLSLIDCAEDQILKYNGSNQWECGLDDDGASAGYVDGTGSAGRIARFTASGTIADSSLTDDGTDAIAHGDFTIQGGDLTLGVVSTTNGAITFHNSTNDNTITLQSGNTGSSYSLTLPTSAGAQYECLKYDTLGQLIWDACEGGDGGVSGVTSLEGLDGAVLLSAGTGISISDDATDTITVTVDTTVTLQGNDFNGASQLVQLNGSTELPAISGLNLTNLNATNIASGTLSVDRIADGSLTNLKLANSSLTVTAGAGLIDGGSISLGSAATLNIGSGDGIAVNADDITLALQDSKGLEVNVDGLSLIDCAEDQILKYNGSNQWECGLDAGGSGVGDNVLVNGTNVDGANFIANTPSATNTATSWSFSVVGPDTISLNVANASDTAAGAVTTEAQTFAGVKTFNAEVITSGGINLGTQTLQGTTAIINFDNFDVDTSGNLAAAGTGAFSGASVTIGASALQGSLVLNDGNSNTVSIRAIAQTSSFAAEIPVLTQNDTFCFETLNNCAGTGDGGVTAVGAIDGGTPNAFGAQIDGSTLYLQNATATLPGLVSTGAQTFAGAKTFNGGVTVAANQTLSLTGGITANRPGSPTEGMLYYDTDTDKLLIYSNGKWQADRSTATMIVAASDTQNGEKADYQVTSVEEAAGNADSKIQAAISALPAEGGTIYLLEGTYTVDTSIIVPSNVTITGSGTGTVITLQNGINADFDIFTLGAVSNVVLRNMKFDGNKSNNSSGSQNVMTIKNGTSSTTATNVTITGLSVENFRNGLIVVSSATGIPAYTNILYKSTITNNYFADNDGIVIHLYGGNNNVLSGNNFTNNGSAFLIRNSGNNVMTDNDITGATSVAVYLNQASNNNVSSNNISGSGLQSIFLNGAKDNIISDNRISGGGVVTPSASHIDIKGDDFGGGNSEDNSVIGNHITDTAGSGFAIRIGSGLSSTIDTYLSDNTYHGTGASSIEDNGTGTIYGGQLDGSGNFQIQPAGDIELIGDTDVTGNLTVSGTGIFSGAFLTIGAAAQQGSLVLNDGSSHTGTIRTASLATDRTYILPDIGTNAVICLDTGNCAGLGGGITGSGIDGQVAYFNGTGTITGSANFLFDGTDTTIGGDLAVNGGDITGTGSLNLQPNAGSHISVNTSGAGDFMVNTNQLYVDSSTSSVGIGDATPAYQFTVGNGDLTGIDSSGNIIIKGAGAAADGSDLSFGAGANRSIEVLTQTAPNTAGNSLTIQAARGNGSGKGGDLDLRAGGGGLSGDGGDIYIRAGSSGFTGSTAGNVFIQAGLMGTDSGSVIVRAPGTTNTAFLIQNGLMTNLLAADTANMRINLGTGTPTLSATGTGNLYVTNISEFAGRVLIGTASNGFDTNSGQVRYTGTFRNDKAVTLRPEFDGLTLNGSGVGTLTSGFCSDNGALAINNSAGQPCNGSSQTHSFYEWTTSETTAESYDMYARYKLPSDFNGFASDSTITLWGRRDTASDTVAYQVYQANGTLCGTGSTTVTSSNDTWQQVQSNGNELSTCSFAAGDVITFKISVTAQNGGTAWVGEIDFTYKSSF